jgi:3-deoxy-D-manno-octulosonic-acid transferase
MLNQRPDLSFLVTSTARSSAAVFSANMPPRCQHQFLPLDAPCYVARFLDHWRPDLSIWAEQEVWPTMAIATSSRGVPLALVNTRLTATGHRRRMRVRRAYADLLARFSLLSAQDEATVKRLKGLGAQKVRMDGSLKASAPALSADTAELERLRKALQGRRIWVAASTHPGDETEAVAAAEVLRDRLLILVPRDIDRADEISAALTAREIPHARRSAGGKPMANDRIWIADSYGELGLWYRLAEVAFIGGGFDQIGGHNPWEAAALDTAILHGPDLANFANDYAQLHYYDAARSVAAGELAQALDAPDLRAVAARAKELVLAARGNIAPLARDLLALLSAATK